jgi:hypothetical protein
VSVINIIPLIKRYEMGDSLTPDERELLTAGLYFFYRAYEQLRAKKEQSK